jgi:hypothetical protein
MILSKAWCDPTFKARLLANAAAALKSLGLSMRSGTTLKVVEDTDSHVHLVLPPRPAGGLTQKALDRMAADAGATWPADILVASAAGPVPAAAVPAGIPRRSHWRVTPAATPATSPCGP